MPDLFKFTKLFFKKWREDFIILGYLFTNFAMDILNSMVDLLIPNSLAISIKFSFNLNFSNISPFWYASHNKLICYF